MAFKQVIIRRVGPLSWLLGFSDPMRKLLAFILMFGTLIPFMLAGIIVAFVISLNLLGIEPHDKSLAAIFLFMLLVPFGVFAGSMLGYGILLSVLRLISCEHWLDVLDTTPPLPSSRFNLPFLWVQKTVYRLIPR